MRAVRLTKPGDIGELKLQAMPIPEPNAHQVRVKVSACGVCHRDVLDRKGAFPFIKHGVVPGQYVVPLTRREILVMLNTPHHTTQ